MGGGSVTWEGFRFSVKKEKKATRFLKMLVEGNYERKIKVMLVLLKSREFISESKNKKVNYRYKNYLCHNEQRIS